jgi:hypothetical protein
MAQQSGPTRRGSLGLGRYRRWAVAAVLLVGLAAGISGLIGLGPTGSAPPQAIAAPVAPAAACAVSYQLEFAATRRMTVHIIATNAGERLPAGWRLTMRMASPPAPGFEIADRSCGATPLDATVTPPPTNANGSAVATLAGPVKPAPFKPALHKPTAIQRGENQNER